MSDTFDDDDIRHDDLEFNPELEPGSSKAWLNLLQESEDAFRDYNTHCDRIDENFAALERLASMERDKQYQVFWANMEVIKPSIYAKPPTPVVTPKFKDRRPVPQQASELAERCAIVAFDLANIDELMKLVRDDVALLNRGVAWCRYESGQGRDHPERIAVDFKNRRDFLHSISRNWREVTWVAAASYMTRAEARARFAPTSGDAYKDVEYKVDKEAKEVGGADNRERGKFWEIWDRTNARVIWVAEGSEVILDEDYPHLSLRNFFPCPKPAYGAVQRNSLVPVPDVLQYRDQLEEVNMLTGRIHALSDAIEVKGFYPAGGGELADAVQTAINIKTPGRVLVPVSNWAAFGGSKEVIIWLPIDVIATTIQGLVALRKQVIDDIYQITGLADIMRGDTDPDETLGAQQIKTQYGSTRIRDKQQEMVRLARDLVEIATEVITEKFDDDTMIEMSQTQLPTTAMVQNYARQLQGQMMQLSQQLQQSQQQAAAQPPSNLPSVPGSPPSPDDDPAQQMMAQGQDHMQQLSTQMQQLQEQPTIEQVLRFLRDNRTRAFVLDIETDSTILADENAEKQRRSEFVGVLSQLLPQLAQMIATDPDTAEFCGEVLKFATAPFRAGRSLDGAIDQLVEQMKAKGGAKGDDPTTAQNKTAIQIEQLKLQQQRETDAGKLALEREKLQQADSHKQADLANQRYMKQLDIQSRQGGDQAKVAVQGQKMQESREAHQAQLVSDAQEMQLQREKADAQIRSQAMKDASSQRRDAMQMMKPAPMSPPGG
jgi:hypothetical protein